MLKILDLFSGIGGFSLGLERTGGFKTVAFCETDEKARMVLRKHWPGVPIYEGVQKVTKDKLKADGISVDVICGGFPCQDLSVAGKGKGLDGERSRLWFEFARLIEEVKPKWAIIENVPVLRSRGLDRVLWSLHEIGYDAEWHCIPASAVGAPIKRERLWIVAQSNGNRRLYDKKPFSIDISKARFRRWENRPSELPARPIKSGWDEIPENLRVAYGVPGWMDRLKQLGNAAVPQILELLGYAVLEAECGKKQERGKT